MISPKIHSRPHRTASEDGFTIIEVLVSIMLLSIVIMLVLSQLTGLFGVSKRSGEQVTATNLAQSVIEQVKGEWQDQPKYSSACITAASLPSGVTVSLQDYDATESAQGAAYSLSLQGTGCGSNPPSPDNSAPLRGVTVTATVNGKATSFEVKVAHP